MLGYRDSEGWVLGDPLNVAITKVALALGWRPPHSRTRFDVLPWVLQCNGRLKVCPIPPKLVREVALRHPVMIGSRSWGCAGMRCQ